MSGWTSWSAPSRPEPALTSFFFFFRYLIPVAQITFRTGGRGSGSSISSKCHWTSEAKTQWRADLNIYSTFCFKKLQELIRRGRPEDVLAANELVKKMTGYVSGYWSAESLPEFWIVKETLLTLLVASCRSKKKSRIIKKKRRLSWTKFSKRPSCWPRCWTMSSLEKLLAEGIFLRQVNMPSSNWIWHGHADGCCL